MPKKFPAAPARVRGVKGRPRPGGDTDLRIQALDMVVRGLGRDIELAGRFLRRIPRCNQPQNLDFAWGQSRQPLGRSAAARVGRRT